MKIAILVGVSKYKDKDVTDLPACNNDVKLMHGILTETGKYDQIYEILSSEYVDSYDTKHKLRNIIIENEGKKIEEVLFYFSGHGHYVDNEFYHIFFRLQTTGIISNYNNKYRN